MSLPCLSPLVSSFCYALIRSSLQLFTGLFCVLFSRVDCPTPASDRVFLIKSLSRAVADTFSSRQSLKNDSLSGFLVLKFMRVS